MRLTTATILLVSALAANADGVKYRGIFVNDEDWSLRPWAVRHFGKDEQIGVRAYEEIFSLMKKDGLNLIWPAMHEGGYEFSSRPENLELAKKHVIAVGTSHCEPMLRNNCYLSKEDKKKWSWTTNRDFLEEYWQEGVRRGTGCVSRVEHVDREGNVLWTIGMRGIHDGKMQDGKTTEEKIKILEEVFSAQCAMLPEGASKLFVPYKEVLPIFNAGLKVPNDATIMWTNDNFGYVRRIGGPQCEGYGGGIYWHASYHGSPHGYIHLCTTPPAFMWYELVAKCWENGVRDVWMVNAGDVFQAEILLDAYGRFSSDPEAWKARGEAQSEVLRMWVNECFQFENVANANVANSQLEIGIGTGNNSTLETFCNSLREKIVSHLAEYYNLGFNRRPEHMCVQWTTNLPASVKSSLLKRYYALLAEDQVLEAQIKQSNNPDNQTMADEYFRLVGFQARFLALAGIIHLEGHDKEYARSVIDPLYERWDKLENGKWSGFWCDTIDERGGKRQPTAYNRWSSQMQWPWNEPANPYATKDRGVARVDYPATAYRADVPEPEWLEPVANTSANGGAWTRVEGLGTSGRALALMPVKPGVGKGAAVEYALTGLTRLRGLENHVNPVEKGTLVLQFLPDFALWPGLRLGVEVSFDGGAAKYVAVPKSDANIGEHDSVRNRAVQDNFIRVELPVPDGAKRVTITAVDPGVVIDRVGIRVELRPHKFEIGESEFLFDGKPFLVRCGEIHYARIPCEYWRHRLKMLRAMGCNAVGCYMFWNFHEREKGVFKWDGRANAAAFCRMAQEEGLLVILRPGPYSCAEWEGGGAPWWLMQDDSGKPISMRSSDPRWVVPATNWLHAVGRELAPLQATKGGPIIMVQVENEYGLHGNDVAYIRALREAVLDAGFEVPLYACNPPRVIQNGFVPELFQAANFGADPEQRFGIVRQYQPKGPLMCAEYYPAWFDTWGQAHHPPKRDKDFFGPIDWMFEHRASFSLYMAHGGTSFGGWSGCRNPFVPNVTSYDYEAPINEQGSPNPSFAKYRRRAAKHLNPGEAIPDVPAPMPVKAYGTATLLPKADASESGCVRKRLEHPVYSERLGVGFGLTIWGADIPAGVAGDLKVGNLHDFGYVYLEGKRIGILDRRHRGVKIDIPAADKIRRLEVLVEQMGRINSSSGMEDRKGLDGRVFVGKTEIVGWEFSSEPIDPDGQENPPGNWRGTFKVDEIADTFVDMRAFNKGIVWVNGKNLGRYWKIGPQQTLYLPGCWLRKGANEIIVREMLEPTGEPTVAFLDHPILDELHPEADFNIVKREHDKFIGGEEVVSGTFPSDGAAQVVMFEKPARGRYFTLQVESSYDAQGLAAIAEFDFLDKDGNPMTSLELSVTGVDSEEEIREDGVAENAIDGQVEAFWLASSRKLPHWIEFCSPVDAEVHGFRCTPRQDRNAGRIREWRFYAR